ncbi:uncharacterized protein LOC144123290 [Amblyomma americanum]
MSEASNSKSKAPSFVLQQQKDTGRAMSSTDLKEYTIRPLLWEELPLTKELRLEIGFIIGTHQLETLWKVDPGSIFGAITDSGELYGVCAVPFVGTDMAYLALLGVTARWRRRGIGKRLLDAAMDHVGTHNIYLHCLPAQVPLFRDRHKLQVYIREFRCLGPGEPKTSELLQSVAGVDVESISKEMLPLVVAYDERVLGCCRQKLLELETAEPDACTALARRGAKRVCGYGFATSDIYGGRIVRGIFADSEDVAEALLAHLLRDASRVIIFVQMRDTEDAYFEKKLGLKVSSTIKTLFRWPSRNGDFTKIYATS